MYSDKITQNVALAVMKVMEEELSAKQKNIAAVAGDPKKIDAEDFKKLRKEYAEPLDELSVNTLSSYGTKAAKTTDKLLKISNKHWAKGYDLHHKNLASGNGPYSKDAEKVIAHVDKSDALLQKRKNRNSSIDLAAKKLGNKFSKGVSEDVVAEAKYEPAKPDAAAVLRRKKIQDIEDRKEKAKAAPSNVRKHEGSAYGGGKQKYDMDESMDAAKSLAQKGMKSEPGSMTSITRDKAGKVTSWQVTGPMKKTGASDSMARARSLAQKGMKLPEEVEQMDEALVAPSPREYHSTHTEYPLKNDLNKFNLKYLHDAHAHHSYTRDQGALVTGPNARGYFGGGPHGAAADAVKRITKHVHEKYGPKAAKQLSHANAPIEGSDGGANFKKTLAHAKAHLEKKKETTSEETTFSGLLASIHENGLTAIHEMFVRESASEEEFNAELKIAQEKSEGKGKKAEIAKGQVQAVKNEETEVVDYELDVNEINGVKMETIDERHLTAAEKEKKEDTVKSMKKGMAGFKERYGDRAKEVMYATATKQAKKDA